jgi:ZIP family zinc transporter
VLAGGTTAEELIEGLSIGIGAAIEPGVGILIALALAIDNLSEGLSIGYLVRSEENQAQPARGILGWTGAIGAAVFGGAEAGFS